MADIEDCSPPADPSAGGRCMLKAALRIRRTILHVVMVTILLSVSLFAYLNLYRQHYLDDHDDHYGVASLVVESVAYAAVACLYIYNSSGWQEKTISAGYLVLVLYAFLVPKHGIDDTDSYIVDEFVFGANMVAISTYCVWQLSFILPTMFTNMVPRSIPLSLKKIMATILHAAIVTILLALVIVSYAVQVGTHNNKKIADCLVQLLVAYNVIGCLCICNSSSQKEKVNSAVFLVNVLFFLTLPSFLSSDAGTKLLFAANIVAISRYCISKLYRLLQRWYDALDGDVVPVTREPARQEDEAALLQLHHQTPFHIQEVLREFSSQEIRTMTQDFGSMIGQGGFAQVFRGNLGDGTAVAVKRMKANSGHTLAAEEDFRRELSVIANVHHRSLVRLLGYCLQRGADGGGLYLVYPFFENGSLDKWIFHGSEEQRRLLTWPKRRCIAVDVARALAYLHDECHRRILHLDVKPGNILLDDDLRAHVSDFGISLSINRSVPGVINTRGRGTLGYMAPEMLVNSVSDRSDVFSYGKTLLELVGGRPNYVAPPVPSTDDTPDLKRDYFPYIVRDMMTGGELIKAVDAAMPAHGVDEEEVKTVVEA